MYVMYERTGPMLMPDTGIFESLRKDSRASREPRVEAWRRNYGMFFFNIINPSALFFMSAAPRNMKAGLVVVVAVVGVAVYLDAHALAGAVNARQDRGQVL